MRDYVSAFKACIRAFRREEKLNYEGKYYSMNLLPAQWQPTRHDFENIKIDISAVGPLMCRVAGELCDGVHVHPMHSMHYITNRLLPQVAKGASDANRNASEIDLMIPVFAVAGDSEEERDAMKARAKTQIAFYGSTPNYAFQFDDLNALQATITDEILEEFAIVANWDDMADKLIARYQGVASRIITYLTAEDIGRNPKNLPRWGEIARAVTS